MIERFAALDVLVEYTAECASGRVHTSKRGQIAVHTFVEDIAVFGMWEEIFFALLVALWREGQVVFKAH